MLIPAAFLPRQASAEAKYDEAIREKVLGQTVAMKLSHHHFNRKNRNIDDGLSKDAFDLFIKRLDPQKRIFLKPDIDRLSEFRTKIDDELNGGNYAFFLLAREIVSRNLEELKVICREILEGDFDYTLEEKFESDSEKLDYCKDMKRLRERWRRNLKFQCLSQYLPILESQEALAKAAESGNAALSGNVAASGNSGALLAPGVMTTTSTYSVDVDVKLNVSLAGNAVAAESGNSESDNAKGKGEEPKDPRKTIREKTRQNVDVYFNRMLKLTRKEYFSRFLNAVTMTFDPHTNYLDPEAKEEFNTQMKKSLEGIGAQLMETDDGFTKVTHIVPGSASHRQGKLKAGDIILRVTQGDSGQEVDITGMNVQEVVKYIRGPKGTTVILTVKKPDGHLETISIVRDIVEMKDAMVKSTVLRDKSGKRPFGYIFLPDFYRDFEHPEFNATRDVFVELRKLQAENIEGLVFDLRSNGGGALEDARSISGLFIERGPIVQIKQGDETLRFLRDDDPSIYYSGPLVIMVNRFSASASEIFAAAMQDYRRAVVVGSGHTHGKGTVQTLMKLEDAAPKYSDCELGDVKVTIQKFYRITGASTQMRGVVPDIVFPENRSALETGECYLEHALPWDTIPAVQFKPWTLQSYDIREIRAKSEKRITASKIFQLITEQDREFTEKIKNTEVSLNIEAMRAERKKAQEQNEKYDKFFQEENGGPEQEKEKEKKEDDGATPLEENDPPENMDHQKWLDNLRKDPYVQETLSILTDMVPSDRK